MAAKILGKGKIVLEYLEKYKEFSKKAVSEKIYLDHPLVFSNPEDARSLVRYYTQAAGDLRRGQVKKEHIRKGYCLPKSKSVKSGSYNLPPQYKSILFFLNSYTYLASLSE